MLFSIILVYGLAATASGLAIDGRYFLVSIPVLIVGLAALWQPSVESGANTAAGNSSGKLGRLSFQAFAVASLVLTLVNLSSFIGFLERGAAPRQIEEALSVKLDNQSIAAILESAGSLDAPIMSNQSQALHVVLRKPTVGVPENRLTPTVWTPDLLVDYAQKFGVEYLVVFKNMAMGWPDGRDDYVWQMVGKEPASVATLYADDAIVLYRMPAVR